MEHSAKPGKAQVKKQRNKFERDLAGAMGRVRQSTEAFTQRPGEKNLRLLREDVEELSSLSSGAGLSDVSVLAVALDIKLTELDKGEAEPSNPSQADLASIVGLVSSLEQTTCCRGCQGQYLTKEIPAETEPSAPPRGEEVFVVGKDKAATTMTARQIVSFGYPSHGFVSLQELSAALNDGLVAGGPAAVVTDSAFVVEHQQALKHLLDDEAKKNLVRPVLVVAGEDELPARLAAANAGATAYFTQPLDVAALIDKLDSVLSGALTEPYRILIVDDDPTLSQIYGLIFQERGWVTYVLTDPMRILEPLTEFNPDLVLMDLYMPGVSGVELAAVIRQYEAYAAIPVVYLSMEEDVAKQVRAVSHGGDDFLSKTMRPDHLVAAVESHARRHRVLRSMLSRDGLTGLLNHSHLRVRIQAEVRRARRMGGRLTLAMLDLDHFKNVNDTYGHLVGDKVLKSLAKLLKQRLRTTDVIGRFGGEEFAVLLLDIDDPTMAARLMDAIRADFARLDHMSDGRRFRVTFSCGMASFPRFDDAQELIEAADKALYAAKDEGRNRVVVASAADGAPNSVQIHKRLESGD